MPCSSSDGMADAYREDLQARRQISDLQQKNNELTDMLCSLLRHLDSLLPDAPPAVVEWYRKHREWDRSQGR